MIVLDASVVIEMLLRTSLGKRLDEDLAGRHVVWSAPHLLDTEVLQVLRRLVIVKELTSDHAAMAVEDLQALDIVRHPHDESTARVWQLRHKLSAYDATYLALAESMAATLVTCDSSFDKIPERRAVVELCK